MSLLDKVKSYKHEFGKQAAALGTAAALTLAPAGSALSQDFTTSTFNSPHTKISAINGHMSWAAQKNSDKSQNRQVGIGIYISRGTQDVELITDQQIKTKLLSKIEEELTKRNLQMPEVDFYFGHGSNPNTTALTISVNGEAIYIDADGNGIGKAKEGSLHLGESVSPEILTRLGNVYEQSTYEIARQRPVNQNTFGALQK